MPLFGGFAQARNFGKGGAGKPPGFVSPAGSLGTLREADGDVSSLLSAAATTGPGDPPIQSYSIVSGSLPTGLSFNTTTAAITGTPPTVGSQTTYNFTVRATSSAGNIDRAFSITVRPAVIVSYTTTGAFTWNVPSGVTEAQVLAVAGGGSGGNIGAGGGGGGVVLATNYPVTPGGTVSGTVGAGGPGYQGSYGAGRNGQNSTFGSITAVGGGGGGGYGPTQSDAVTKGGPGGSTGGASGRGKRASYDVNSQPQPAAVGSYTAYGGKGGPGVYAPVQHWGAGGGGAGGAGDGVPEGSIKGGRGAYFSNFTSHGSPGGHFAGGGGGGQWTPQLGYPAANRHGGQSAPVAGGAGQGLNNSSTSQSGAANTGGGGGGTGHPAPGTGGTGGSGIVLIRY